MVWRVPLFLALPDLGRIGNIGAVDVVVLIGLTSDIAYIHDPARDAGPTAVEINAFLVAWSDMDHYCATIKSR
jgi:hypothetical protein